MKIVTAKEMGEMDRRSIEEYGIAGIVLMENAGIKVVEEIFKLLGDNLKDKSIAILVGKGNNGGDGLVIARHLYNKGARVAVFLLAEKSSFKGDAKTNLTIWENMKGKIYPLISKQDLELWQKEVKEMDLLVDAIYGTGFRGEVNDFTKEIILTANHSLKPIVTVDIPSGVIANSGEVGGIAILATLTVSLALPKLGLLLYPGASFVGELKVVDISIPSKLLEEEEKTPKFWLKRDLAKSFLPPRQKNAHKGDCGRSLVIGGSRGMSGSICLTGQAVAKSGAGLITVAVPEGIQQIIALKLTEVMSLALPQTSRVSLNMDSLPILKGFLNKIDALALGPGLSSEEEGFCLVREIIKNIEVPTVLDADGLNALALHTELFPLAKAPLILTPHPGEMARLTGLPVRNIVKNSIEIALKYAKLWQVVLVLKGAPTVIATKDRLYLNSTGNSGMATGGSGDVLTGIITGLLAQGLEPERAACLGVYLHGLAGDEAKKEKGERGMLAGDILNYLPIALKNMED